MSSSETTATEEQTPWPAPWRGWLLVLLLAATSMVSQFDRTVINLMVEPIKGEFGLNDTAFGALQGVAFGMFYVIACIPLGRMADNYSRKWLIGTCLFFWTLFAMASGLARSYVQLFLTRIGVAVGEAALTPAGLSMLSDHFPPDRLARPVSGFMMSAPVGQGLAFIAGGSLLTALAGSPLLEGGMLDGFEPWQAAFIIVGAPGLLLVPLYMLCREPVRRGTGAKAPIPFKEVIGIMQTRWRALVPMFIGFSMVKLVIYSIGIWSPALLQRTYGWTTAEVGLGFGLVLIIAGTSGVYFAGLFTDMLARKGHLDATLKVAVGGFALAGTCGAIAPLMDNPILSLTLLSGAIFFGNMPFSCAATALQLIVPNRARGQISAVYITFTTLVGLAVGPTTIGAITDFVFKDPSYIRYSMALAVAVATPLMIVMITLAMRPYRSFRNAAA